MVEVEVRDRDRVDVRPAFPLAETAEDPGPAVDEQAAAVVLDDVAGMRSARVGPGGGAADDREFHRRILPTWSGRYGS